MQNAGMHHNYSETLVLRKDTFFGLNGGVCKLNYSMPWQCCKCLQCATRYIMIMYHTIIICLAVNV